jgi:hypothetical protein
MGAHFLFPVPSKGFSAPRRRTNLITGTALSRAFANVSIHLPLAALTAPPAWERLTGCTLMRWSFVCCGPHGVEESTHGGWLNKAGVH